MTEVSLALTLALGVVVAPDPPPPGVPVAVSEVGRTERIRFHSDPWINLHHFLYQWARDEAGVASGRQEVVVEERGEVGRLPAADRRVWDAAVAFYRATLADRGHFDDDMLTMKAALLTLADRPGATASDVIPADRVPGSARHLDAAMEVYRRAWWPEHDAANRAWIADVLPLAQRYEPTYVSALERAFGGAWTEEVRLDASAYANWAGGYTSNRPPHTVVWSTDPRNGGLYGLELVYHEASHVSSLGRPNIDGVRAAFEAVGAEAPDNLWHAIIFHTSGWVTRGVAAERGLPEHVPYMVVEGLVDFRGWSGLWPALEAHWAPFLEGDGTREQALAALARELGG